MATPARLAPASQFPAAACDKPDHDHRDERHADPSAAALRTRDRGRVQED